MTQYRNLPTGITGCRLSKMLQVLVLIYKLVDFCGIPQQTPVPPGADFKQQLEALFAASRGEPDARSRRLAAKNHCVSHVEYPVDCAVSNPDPGRGRNSAFH